MTPSPQSQLEVIYRQLGRSSGFTGFRPRFLLVVSAGAAVATLLISLAFAGGTLRQAAIAWLLVAALIALLVFLTVLLPALRSTSMIQREAAQATGIQMIFPLGVGLAATAAVLANHPGALPYLPAIWLGIFGLGISALSGLIRERVEYVAVFYLAAGVLTYFLAPTQAVVFALAVGLPFTLGHLLTAWVLKSRKSAADQRRREGEGAEE